MFAVTRSIRVANDARAAIAHAVKIVEHIKTWKGVDNCQCWMQLSGPVGTLVFVLGFDDAKTWEKTFSNMLEDDAYWALVQKGVDAGLFDMSSAQDSMLRLVV